MEKTLNKRIDQGVKWLDKKLGRKVWLRKIKTKSLDLSNSFDCIYGQLFGNFFAGIDKLGLGLTRLGFATNNKDYDLLTKLWVKHIKILRKKAK